MPEDCAMSWSARRDREQFTGWIAGLGTPAVPMLGLRWRVQAERLQL
jgi:hypothetical protein